MKTIRTTLRTLLLATLFGAAPVFAQQQHDHGSGGAAPDRASGQHGAAPAQPQAPASGHQGGGMMGGQMMRGGQGMHGGGAGGHQGGAMGGGMHGHMAGHAAGPATRDYHAAMRKMHHDMMAQPLAGDADRDLALMMIPHHQGAADMARAHLQHGKDPKLRAMSEKMLKQQEQDIAELKKWLAEHPKP